jgi:hypothetical protein
MINQLLGMIGLRVAIVRYHCGGWPEEVNTCLLNSYMVYLLPKLSLGYQQHSFRLLLLRIYIHTTGIIHHCNHSIIYTGEIGFVHDYPLAPLVCPLPLTWNPPCCDRIRPPLSRVARKLTPFISLTCPCGPSPEIPTPWGFSRPKYTFIRTTLQTQPICSCTAMIDILPDIASLLSMDPFLTKTGPLPSLNLTA